MHATRNSVILTILISTVLLLGACTAIQPVTPEGESASSGDMNSEIEQLVSEALMQELQIEADAIEVVSVEAVEWPDACLGVTNPDEMCAQVITPGYRVILDADGRAYEYHTNEDGSSIRLAEAP